MKETSTPFAIDGAYPLPGELEAVLEASLPLLREYNEAQRTIDRQLETDYALRLNPPQNPLKSFRQALLNRVRNQLIGANVVGWHCTKLCEDEIASICSEGMYPLSPETSERRVQRRLDAGDVTSIAAAALRTKNQTADANRQMLWFVFTRKLLRTSGVTDFFTYWGGEAIYNSHDRDPITGPVLRAIGKPCIIEISLPLESVVTFGPIEERVVRAFLSRNGISDGESPDCEGYTRDLVAPHQIRRVITTDDDDFQILTGH